jgi:hypothetical protein
MSKITTTVDEVDRTKAFDPTTQEEINKMPSNERYRLMARPNSKVNMAQEEIEKHYKSSNYPVIKYHSSGGGGSGTISPPGAKL